MTKLTILIIALFLTACGGSSSTDNKPKHTSIFVLFENGGTVANEDRKSVV